MLRGSLDRRKGDTPWDLRKIEPYCGYETYQFDAVIPPFDMAPPEAKKRKIQSSAETSETPSIRGIESLTH